MGLKNNVHGRTDNCSVDIEFNELETRSNIDIGQIQVVTVVEQDVENIGEQRLGTDKEGTYCDAGSL